MRRLCFSKKHKMSFAIFFFSLLLLLLLVLLHPKVTHPAGSRRISGGQPATDARRFDTNASRKSRSGILGAKPPGSGRRENGDEIFDAEKRRVRTGPNPLHNR
ncbi:hypothetical protein DM860_005901 [Cuscuta australis]|uniref:Uncharacterized protein n=1 Tax=Cuscuta australis TaxID=267555 RepID=A0A328DS07_9ASTE|nr:hypothetical protein DM860_005901 [Cuscuta australis]